MIMEKINIAELLKNAPSGIELYTPIYGVVKFGHLFDNQIVTFCKSGGTLTFDEYGRLVMSDNEDAECVLYPSKGKRDWSKFHKSQILK